MRTRQVGKSRLGGLIAAILWSSSALVVTAEEKLNVVLIVADDLGWADLGCYGSTFHRTPKLDQMAREGARFTQAYSACPVCSPTRAALMTGKWPARLQLTDWLPGRPDRPDQRLLRPAMRQQLPLEETTIAEVFRAAGYATGHIGKWHLGGDGFGPREQGFDTQIAGDQTGTPLSYFAPYRSGSGKAKGDGRAMPGLETAPEGEYLTDRLAAEAEKFLEQHRDRPFFLYLPHYAVHTPMKAPADRVAAFPGEMKLGQQSNPIYAAMLASLDTAVGRVRAKLQELGLTDRTLVIFTSDNGGLATTEGPNTPATNNSPMREGKGYLYEGGIRVPLLMVWPGKIPAESVVKTPAISNDILPTTVAAANLPSVGSVDGVDLSAVVRGGPSPERDTLYWHYPHYSNQGGRPGGAIRQGDWKLVEFYETGRRELFDLAQDPRENRNLATERPADVDRLAKLLADWRRTVGAQEMTPNPDYVPNPPDAAGKIVIPAKTADVSGTQLRYEPLPHKNTLGFWVDPGDAASWEFTVTKPGKYRFEAWQGCGTGQGGSVVEFAVGDQKLEMTVEDTGHFQNFKPRDVGVVDLPRAGRWTLTLRAKSKARAAVMDLRQVILHPVP